MAAWLLTGARQGYSVHYATLTTLLLRCCGIPARYVEGYVVTRQQAEALSDGAQLTLTQRAAHAWAEYYLDGVGWIPFDTVPGYEENIVYQLPEDGDPAENENGTTYTGRIKRPNRTRPTSLRSPRTTTASGSLSRACCWPWRHWCWCVWQPWRCGRCCCGEG